MAGRFIRALLLASICMAPLFAHSSTADDRRISRNSEGAASTLSSATGERVALIIGNAAYKSAPLNNPVNDARLLANTLRGLDFEVTERTNATRPQMRQAIDEFGGKLRDGMIAIFYYSGHGMQVNGNNYMIPVDASIHTEQDVEDDGVNVGRLLGKMEDIKDGLNIVILDACRDNPYKRSFKSDTQGLAFMNAPSGTIIAYATAPGKTAADGMGANSPYMESLSQTIVQPGLRIDDVFMRVGNDVERKTGGKQVPWKSDNLRGVFYLKPPSGTGGEPIEMAGGPGPIPEKPKPETAKTGSIKVKTTPAGAMLYLDGVRKGFTPMTITGVSPGNVNVKVVLDGYLSREDAVEVKTGLETPASFALARVEVPAPTPVVRQAAPFQFDYDYQSGRYVRRARGTVVDPQRLWQALRPLQPPPGARGGYGLIGDDDLLGREPGFGLRELGGIARRFITFDSIYVVQPPGFSHIGVQEGVFTSVDALNDTTLGWVFFDLRPKFEADMKQRLNMAR